MIRIVRVAQIAHHLFRQCDGKTEAEVIAILDTYRAEPIPSWIPKDRAVSYRLHKSFEARIDTVSETDICGMAEGWLKLNPATGLFERYRERWDSS